MRSVQKRRLQQRKLLPHAAKLATRLQMTAVKRAKHRLVRHETGTGTGIETGPETAGMTEIGQVQTAEIGCQTGQSSARCLCLASGIHHV